MNRAGLLSLTVYAALAAMLCRCSDLPSLAGGGGTETIIGRVVYTDGSAAPRTEVVLRAGNYNPVTGSPALDHPFIDTTNDSGIYRFAEVKYGGYSIQALHLDSLSRALHSGIAIAKDAVPALLDTLRLPGTIKVMRPDGVDTANGYLYIPGTDIAVLVGSDTGAIIIGSVPAGLIPSVNYTVSNGSIQLVIRYDVPVPSGDTVVVANPAWKYSKRIYLNTSASGAGVPGNVIGFPVLVRLTGSNFIFNEAKYDGSDLRFAKPDNTPLPYEIERWDPVTELAEVWVRMDTVYGNDTSRYFTMFWGDSGAIDISNSAAVFDTGSGFQGVWHLNESSGSSANEATANSYRGTFSGSLPRVVNGAIGMCQSFNGTGDYVDMGNVLDVGFHNLSISAWIRTGTAYVQLIAGKSNGDNPSATYGYLMTIDLTDKPHIYIASGGSSWGDAETFDVGDSQTVIDTNWHYITAVLDRSGNNNCRLYVDGMDRTDTTRGDISSVGNASNTLNFRIGAQSNGGYPFNGLIDEVVAGYTIRSADWVRLCYMNQKSSDMLLKIEQ